MNRKSLMHLGILMLGSVFTHAQSKFAADNFVTRMGSNLRLQGPKQYEAEGSPYLLDDFILSAIYANSNKASGILVRYNVFEDYMEFKHQGSLYMLMPDKSVEKVVVGEVKFVVEEYSYKGKLKMGYLQMLDSGKVILFSRKEVNLIPAKEATPMQYNPTPAKFERLQDVLYYKIGKGITLKVENIKKIIANLPDHTDEMSAFVKENQISTRNEEEVIKLFKFYNSL
jgi:hypothetical protein